MNKNLIMMSDSYKFSHSKGWNNCEHEGQYPPGTEAMFSYIEARAGEHLVFFGLQMFIKEYLLTPITSANINQAEKFCAAHGEPFNREGWEYILKTYNGYMPVKIKAVPEGMVTKNRNAICTVECHDPKCYWIVNFLETCILRSIWYPSTVATVSFDCKQTIAKYLEMTSDNQEQIAFKLHDFGGRGVSSGESAAIGGAAHLVNFMGSDTVEGILAANEYYNCDMAAFSIPAAEHSTITSWGKENEVEAYRNMLKQYGGQGKLVACVSDSYDIFNACENLWGGVLKDDVINMGGTLVIRPDSGDPAQTVARCVEILADKFGFSINSKGFKVLPDCVRVIQGDGINRNSIEEILSLLKFKGFAADNVAFGMGGALLQHMNRDTFGFAMKCCALKVNGEWQDVFKEAPGKNSKRGRLTMIETPSGLFTCKYENLPHGAREVLQTVYNHDLTTVRSVDGQPRVKECNFNEVRANAVKGVQA